MRSSSMIAVAASLALSLGSAAALHGAEKEKVEAKELKMSIEDVPAAVRKGLQREANGAKIKTVDKEEKDGKTVYETDVDIDGDNYEIVVDAKGKLISKKLDPEEGEKPAAKEKKEKSASEGKSAKAGKGEKEEDDDKPAKKASAKSKAKEQKEGDDDEKPAKSSAKKEKPEKDEKGGRDEKSGRDEK